MSAGTLAELERAVEALEAHPYPDFLATAWRAAFEWRDTLGGMAVLPEDEYAAGMRLVERLK